MEQDPSKYLIEARRQMVEQRHHIIKYLASAYDREQMEAHIHMIQKIQDAIDIIDRVSREERISPHNEVGLHVGRGQDSPIQTEHAAK